MIDSYVRIFSLHMQAYVSGSYDPRFFLGKCSPPPWQKVARTPNMFGDIAIGDKESVLAFDFS